MNSLNAISPIDGRYRSKVEPLANYFSEGALIRYRVQVEIEYFIALGQLAQLPTATATAEGCLARPLPVTARYIPPFH